MHRTIERVLSGVTVILLATACGSQPPAEPAEPRVAFGDTVRNVMNSQIHDYDAAINPSPDAIEGSDPDRLNNVVEAYREHISKPEEVRQPIEISVGGN
jgi:hypothetical protein